MKIDLTEKAKQMNESVDKEMDCLRKDLSKKLGLDKKKGKY